MAPSRLIAAATLSMLVSFAGIVPASAYIGESYMNVPGVAGGWKGDKFRDWVRVEANYWKPQDVGMYAGLKNMDRRLFFSGPQVPKEGSANTLMISIDKTSPAVPQLMEQCAKKTKISELTYAEESWRARGMRELGPRPVEVPEFFEYKLKDVVFAECPVVADAAEQAFVVNFNDIAWLNYKGEGQALKLPPGDVRADNKSGETKSFVVTWFAVAHDVADDQCPVMNVKSTEADYFALMSKADADKERAQLGEKGVSYETGQMERRGPNKLNVCLMPGIVKDPGHALPQTAIARGLNLDGDDGTGAAPANTCKHKNYAAADGRTGIDNQLYTAEGCVAGYMGHKGFRMQYANEQRRNGLLSMLVEISGIDNARNDDHIDVTLLYSLDDMSKDGSGAKILPDYTFRVTDNPEYTPFFRRLSGKLVDGVVYTDLVDQLSIHPGMDRELKLMKAGLRLELLADGSLKGVVGGYQDWRNVMMSSRYSVSEQNCGFLCPGLFNAYKRLADGLKDPVTGQCNGISSAYDVEGVPAFLPPGQRKALLAQAN